jgi:NAD(P)-dependent dehydrogenase (short-subunit alcohol dehydrogenase family)
MGKFQNKVAIVTGGNSGIGYATAEELIKEGATLIITGRNKQALEEAAEKLGAIAFQADQSNLDDLDKLYEFTKEKFGKIDILFINAGVAKFAPLEFIDIDLYNYIFDINVKGALFTLQKLSSLLNKNSSVTFLSSISAYLGMPNSIIYGASKAALNTIMRTAAIELAPNSVRVNAVCPGPIETPIFEKSGLAKEQLDSFATHLSNRSPLKRFGKPEEVAKLVAFLSSDDAQYITGVEYVIDGGQMIISAQ